MRPKILLKAYPVILLRLVEIIIIIVFLLGNYFNFHTGWADNGDYSRIMTWFTSGPAYVDNWPKYGTQAWSQRYYFYWIPDWNLDFPQTSTMFSSALIVWVPGIVINRLFFSMNILYLPIMSLGARVVTLLLLFIIMFWIDRRSQKPIIYHFTLTFPLALLFSTSDVAAFFNTFYQENGAIVFIPFLVLVVVLGNFVQKNWQYYLLYFITSLCVTTSKAAFFYWPIIMLPLVLPWKQLAKKPMVWIPIALWLVAIPVYIGIIATRIPSDKPIYQYNAIFSGTLALSSDPKSQVDRLGMQGAMACVGVDLYNEFGFACMNKYQNKLSYLTEIKTILNEPQILLKELWVISHNMQNYSLHLGKHENVDEKIKEDLWLNLWSVIKQAYFPRGWLLIISVAFFCIFIAIGWRQNNFIKDLALGSTVCLIAFITDSFVQIWGDGQRDLLKHLFIANMLYDFTFILSVNILISMGIRMNSNDHNHGIHFTNFLAH